jgi:hypothetical protein
MRNISFSETTPQVKNRIKTQTRRLGWLKAKRGDVLMSCEKCQGIKKGELVRLGAIRLTNVRREPLNHITQADCVAEGFPDWTPAEFVKFFCEFNGKGVTPETMVTVLEFEYI